MVSITNSDRESHAKPLSLSSLAAQIDQESNSGNQSYSTSNPGTSGAIARSVEGSKSDGTTEKSTEKSTRPNNDLNNFAAADSKSKSVNLSGLAAQLEVQSKLPNLCEVVRSDTPPRTATLSEFAGKYGTPPTAFSLSALAAQHTVPHPSRTLSDNKPLKQGTPPRGISLSELAVQHNTPPNSSGTPPRFHSLSERTVGYSSSPKSTSLAALAASQCTPPKPCGLTDMSVKQGSTAPIAINLSDLAKTHGWGSSCAPETKIVHPSERQDESDLQPVNLSDLAKKHSVPSNTSNLSQAAPKHDSAKKEISLASLAASHAVQPSPVAQANEMGNKSHIDTTETGKIPPGNAPPGFKPKQGNSKAPPGFEDHMPKPRPLGLLNLSDLAAQHKSVVIKPKTDQSQKHRNIPIVVPKTEPSQFAKALGASFSNLILKSHSKCSRRSSRSSRFSYCKQSAGTKSIVIPEHVIVPFDFSTPSPDDIVKSKQKAAFSRESYRKYLDDI